MKIYFNKKYYDHSRIFHFFKDHAYFFFILFFIKKKKQKKVATFCFFEHIFFLFQSYFFPKIILNVLSIIKKINWKIMT